MRKEKDMATLRDIAERAQVSIATVSLYLNGKSKGRISESTMQKIKNAIDELQYQPTKSKALLHHLETEDRQRTIAVTGPATPGLRFWARSWPGSRSAS